MINEDLFNSKSESPIEEKFWLVAQHKIKGLKQQVKVIIKIPTLTKNFINENFFVFEKRVSTLQNKTPKKVVKKRACEIRM